MYKYVSNKNFWGPKALHHENLELVVEDIEKRYSGLN